MSNEFEDRHMAFIEKLYGIDPGDYWKQDIPSTLDHEILRYFSKELTSNTSALKELGELIINAEPAMVTLGIFGNRMASYTVRSKSNEVLKSGLIALSISKSKDIRDVLVTFSLFHHAATKIGLNANTIFQEVATVLGSNLKRNFITRKITIKPQAKSIFTEVCAELVAFSQRKPTDQAIDSMCYEEGEGLGGFLFKPDSSWG
ncbi:MAG: hypothetical protein P8179_20520 [Candidatus Thiodiazotropha sp.]|jgi:hypothetical protein